MVIINKREESKLRTRELILENTKNLIIEGGILSLTTADISKACNIAHGSIFQHFGNREGLINSVLEQEIKRITVKIKNNCEKDSSSKDLFESYLIVLSEDEDFFCTLYRELPFLPEDIKMNVIALEAIFRNAFFLSISKESNQTISEKDITIRLDALFSVIIRYLSLKEFYAPSGDVMKTRSKDIKRLFEVLFKEE